MYHRPYTERTIKQINDGVPQEEIIKELKKDLSKMKSNQREWKKEAYKIIESSPSYERPRGIGPDFSAKITDLQLAIATLTDFDITKSILPANRGEIIYAIEKNPKNIFYVKDLPLNNENFDYAFYKLSFIDSLSFKERDEFRKELLKAVFSKNKEKSDELIDKYSKSFEQSLNENNIDR